LSLEKKRGEPTSAPNRARRLARQGLKKQDVYFERGKETTKQGLRHERPRHPGEGRGAPGSKKEKKKKKETRAPPLEREKGGRQPSIVMPRGESQRYVEGRGGGLYEGNLDGMKGSNFRAWKKKGEGNQPASSTTKTGSDLCFANGKEEERGGGSRAPFGKERGRERGARGSTGLKREGKIAIREGEGGDKRMP